MAAYVIGHITVKDKDKWDEYTSKVPSTLEKYNAKLVCRGTLNEILSGNHNHQNSVVIEFIDIDAVKQWYNSNEYQQLIEIREIAADIDLISFEA